MRTKSTDAAPSKSPWALLPDYVYQGEGMRIDGVIDGRVPETKVKPGNGDIIIRIGDTEVKDIYGYMEGLSAFKTGDKTTVVVKRGRRSPGKVEF